MSAPDILDVALWLARRHGLHLFRVDHPGRPECVGAHRECDGQRGKHPACQWSRVATCNPLTIKAMLGYGGPWNLGIACKQSRLLGADEDRPGAFAEYAASIGETVPSTLAVDTAKGRHWYFRQSEDVPLGNGTGKLKGLGIDIRGGGTGNGGFLVGPGSVHATGVVYTPVDSSAPILPVPAWLAEALKPCVPEPRRTGRPVSAFGALNGLVRTVLEATPERDRNNRLYWSACRAAELVAEGTVDAGTATAVLVDAAARTGLSETEARRTVESGMRTTERVRHG
jgi:hypothetical protein